jgi:hypothetical protein
MPSSSSITTAQALFVTVGVNDATGSSAPTGTVVLTSGGYSRPPNLPYIMPALTGIYDSSLTTADLASNSGLSNTTATYVDALGAVQGSATGVAAATPGQTGTASIPFLHPLDATQPARINVHLCIGSSTTSSDNNQLKIYFSNGPNPADGLYFSVGMNSMQLQMWGTPELTNYGSTGIPSGTCGSVFMDWLGTGPGGVDAQGNEQMWAGWIPDNPTDLQAPNNTAIPSSYEPTALGFSAVLDASMLSNTTGIFISDASANTMVTGVYVSQGRLDGPIDGAMPVPGLFQPVVLDAGNIIPSYQSNEVWIPPTYGDSAGNPIVQTYHPNGAVADIHYGRFGVYANLFDAGYILVAVTGDNGDGYSAWGGATYWDSPTSASWGGPSGGQYRNAVMGLVRQYLPSGNQYFRMGLSAGAADALNDEMRNPGASGIALYSGVISITGAWNQAGQPAPGGGTYSSFLPNIQYGWGDWYLSLQGSNTNETPESSPSFWTKVSSTLAGLPLSYYNAWEFTQKGAWNVATTYNQNDIAVRPYTGTISGLSAGDPSLNFPSFAKVPIQAWAEENDSTIMSPVWQTAFIDGVTAAGNKNAVSNILTDCPADGGCHLTSGVLNPTNNQPWNITTSPSPTLAWFNSLRTPWSVSSSGSYTSAAAALTSGSATIDIPAGSLALGTGTLTATYIPDAASSSAYNSATGSNLVTVSVPMKTAPTIIWAIPATITYSTVLSATQLDASSTVAGSFAYSPAAGTLLNAGLQTLTVTFTPSDSTDYTTATASVTLIVNKATPTVTVTLSSSSITTAQALTVTVAVSGGSGGVAPSGTVALTSGSFSSASANLTAGSTTINIPVGSLATGADTITVAYAGDTNFNSSAGSASVTVATPISPSFTVTGTAVTVAPGATSGNASTIAVTPTGGFTGSVTLTAAVTSSPAGAQYPPTLSFGSTNPMMIAGAASGTATLTISTTPATSATLVSPKHPGVPWYAAGGTLACILLFGIPTRRRSWRTMLGMLVLLAIFACGAAACGGGGGGGASSPGTTAGTYTVTVTGTSGAVTAISAVTLTVL